MWEVTIIDGQAQIEMDLNAYTAMGWEIRHITSHGMNCWTVFLFKPGASKVLVQGTPGLWARIGHAARLIRG